VIASVDVKLALTARVQEYERFQPPSAREQLYGPLVSTLNGVQPWTDEGSFYAKWAGLGWWDTWRNLRTRVDAATPSRAARVSAAAPDSVATAAAQGFKEGAAEGAANLGNVASNIAEGSQELVNTVSQVVRGSPILVWVGLGLLAMWAFNKANKG
jgi:hypothetical protein